MIATKRGNRRSEFEENPIYPHCSVCGKKITEGYHSEDTGDSYCSDECLNVEVSDKDYYELYDAGIMYWTEWY